LVTANTPPPMIREHGATARPHLAAHQVSMA
jgi:hypothetical protein